MLLAKSAYMARQRLVAALSMSGLGDRAQKGLRNSRGCSPHRMWLMSTILPFMLAEERD
jgi:hypothetical protein